MAVAAIVLANISRIFRLGRESMAIALAVSAELVLWCGLFISLTIGSAGAGAFPLKWKLFWFAGVPFIIAAALYVPLLPKLGRRPPEAA